MKKVLTILVVLTLIAGAAFATDGNKVVLTTTIAQLAPSYQLQVKQANDTFSATDRSVASIADADVSADFKVLQVGTARIASGRVITVEVTCGAFINAAGDSTEVPEITAVADAAVRTNLTFDDDAAADSNVVTFQPKYGGSVAAGEIGTFTAKWDQREDLPAGTYTADITLSYTTI